MGVFAASECALPDGALLDSYRQDAGNFTDCYGVEVSGKVPLSDFVAAFYTTRLFKLERGLLSLILRKSATDEDAECLAKGHSDTYSAWTVEARDDTQLLMCPVDGKTRSWFMVESIEATETTRLYFGSAVVARPKTGFSAMAFTPLLWFHELYSLALLSAAKSRLTR